MVYENPGKNSVYTVFDGDIGQLADKLRGFCEELFGDRCEFYRVSIEREKDAVTWKVHEYPFLNDAAVNAVKNHLNARKDLVRVRFGDSEKDYDLEFIVCHARNTGSLARFVKKKDLQQFDEGSMVVVAVEKNYIPGDGHREFLKSLE